MVGGGSLAASYDTTIFVFVRSPQNNFFVMYSEYENPTGFWIPCHVRSHSSMSPGCYSGFPGSNKSY